MFIYFHYFFMFTSPFSHRLVQIDHFLCHDTSDFSFLRFFHSRCSDMMSCVFFNFNFIHWHRSLCHFPFKNNTTIFGVSLLCLPHIFLEVKMLCIRIKVADKLALLLERLCRIMRKSLCKIINSHDLLA